MHALAARRAFNARNSPNMGQSYELLLKGQKFSPKNCQATGKQLHLEAYKCFSIMGTKEKLRERFLKMPADFIFEEMQRLLEGYGYEKGNKNQETIQGLE